jgi:hypothetical protein
MNRILLQHNAQIRKLLSYRQDKKDGSLYITFTLKGNTTSPTRYHHYKDPESPSIPYDVVEDSVPKRFEIHYHTTGRINFKDLKNPSIFGEPITAITQKFWFASLIVPELIKLDPHESTIKEADYVLPAENMQSKLRQFDLCISPFGDPITSYGNTRAHVSYPKFYTLNIIETECAIPHAENEETHFTFMTPRVGLFKKQQVTRETAHINFHQSQLNHNGPIMFGPNGEYEYRVIFPIAATVQPSVKARFDSNEYSLGILSVSKSEVRFNVVNSSGGIVKTPINFSRVELGYGEITLL